MEKKEIKILYHGAGLSGRTTNLRQIYDRVFDIKRKSYDYKPFSLNVNEIKSIVGENSDNEESKQQTFTFRTAPMNIHNNPYKEKLIREMDAFVFVVDSQEERIDSNIYALWETETILKKCNRDICSIPWVIQYNKRDLPNILSVTDLQKEFNHYHLPYFESIAYKSIGVFETFSSFVSELDRFYNVFD